MPRISAGSVREQRAQRLDQLVEAAGAIMAEQGVSALTAGSVAARAGIARNSIYRYFDSIEHLVELVVIREFTAWVDAVRTAVRATSQDQRPVVYVRTNIELAARGSHGRRVAMSRDALDEAGRRRVKEMHTALAEVLGEAVAGLAHPLLAAAVVQAVTDACIKRVDAGDDAAVVIDYATGAVASFASSAR